MKKINSIILLCIIVTGAFTSCASTYGTIDEFAEREPVEVIDVYTSDIINSEYFEYKENEDEVIGPDGIHVSSVISIDELLKSDDTQLFNVASAVKEQDLAKASIIERMNKGETVDTALDDTKYSTNSGDIAKNATEQSFTYIDSSNAYQESIAVYTYVEGRIYEIITSPDAITDFRLKPGEQISGEPVVNDGGLYWTFTMGTSIENGIEVQHLFIKPQIVGLDTSMIILTNQRTYYFRIASFSSSHMTAVKFNYPGDVYSGFSSAASNSNTNSVSSFIENNAAYSMNMTKSNYNYRIKIYRGNPTWVPQTVFSDSIKTCIQFPVSISVSNELPSVYLVTQEQETLVNYHIAGNLYIIDAVLVGNQYFLLKSGSRQQVKILRAN